MRVFRFMRYKYWLVGLLAVVLLFVVAMVVGPGLDLGIEFKGGMRAEIQLERPAAAEDVRQVVEANGVEGAIVRPVGDNSYRIEAKELGKEQYESIFTDLSEEFGAEKAAAGMEQVGPTFGQETGEKALIAIIAAIAVIILYISWRFEFKFAIPAIAALVHDVAITIAVYAATDRLVTTATVAALLTILGYSVNDTIIVFDRVRENTMLMKRESYAYMVDLSIRQTLTRSINTSLTTLLPIGAILFFGGATLKDFAFALFIGIAAGTYSSIFVASPLLTIWKEREPRYRRRALAEQESWSSS